MCMQTVYSMCTLTVLLLDIINTENKYFYVHTLHFD